MSLIPLLEKVLNQPRERRNLLQNPKQLKEILNDIPTRRWLFEQTCQNHDRNRASKARLFIFEIMQSSGQIWRRGQTPEVYEEALARNLEWFIINFHSYDPERASFITWFNNKLKWKIIDVILELTIERSRRISDLIDSDGEAIDPAELLPAPNLDRWQETLEEWIEWVHKDPDRQLRNCRMQNYPQVECQALLLEILIALRDSGEFSWKQLAHRFEVEQPALKKFCRSRCSSCFSRFL